MSFPDNSAFPTNSFILSIFCTWANHLRGNGRGFHSRSICLNVVLTGCVWSNVVAL